MKLTCSWRQRSLGRTCDVCFVWGAVLANSWIQRPDVMVNRTRSEGSEDPQPFDLYREMESSETKMSCFIQFWCHQVTHWDALKVKELSETFEGKASFLKARLWCCVSVLFSNVEQQLQPVEVIMFFSTTWITCTLLVMDCALFAGDGRQGDTWWVTWVTCQENLRLTLR